MPRADTKTNGNTLQLEGVVGRFGGLIAVQDVSMDIRHGERRALLGPNGAGKTTLFNLIAGVHRPSAGNIRIGGQDVTRFHASRRVHLGLRRTYQNAKLFDGLTVRENLLITEWGINGGWHSAIPFNQSAASGMRDKVESTAARVGLCDDLGTRVSELSHGKRRQVEIGMALAGEPRIMLLDEPAAGLSPGEREMLDQLLESLPDNMTLMMIEHDIDIALRHADVVTVLHNGRLIAEGTPAEIVADPTVKSIYMGGA